LYTSQKSSRKTSTPKVPKATRRERATLWRAQFTKKSVESILKGLPPGTGAAKKSLKKKAMKGLAGKLSFAISDSKKKKAMQKKKKAAQAKAAAQKVKPGSGVPEAMTLLWASKEARVVSPTANLLWQNSKVKVKRLVSETSAEVELIGSTVKSQFPLADLYLLAGGERPPWPPCDFRKVLALEKAKTLEAAGSEVQFVSHDNLMEHPELASYWQLLLCRVRQSSSENTARTFYLGPEIAEWLTGLPENGVEPADESLRQDWQNMLTSASEAVGGRTLIVSPIKSASGHWTLLSLQKDQSEEHFTVQHFDSLQPLSESSRMKAAAVLSIVAGMLKPGQATRELPATEVRTVQIDGTSCGLHVCMRMEELVRQWRGEGRVACYSTVREVAKQTNQWVQALNVFKGKQKVSTELPPVPPPLPPPAKPAEAQGASQCAAAMTPLAASRFANEQLTVC
jgi:hypothetical protein